MAQERPAILGGKRAFPSGLPIVKPVLPDFGQLQEGFRFIVSSGILTKGRYLEELEREMASYLGLKHAVAVSSCTAGLILTLQSLELEGSVILPSFTFMASAHAVVWNRLKPVFVDIDERSWNVDPSAVEAAVISKPRAILAVHNFGNPAAIGQLEDIAARWDLRLVFDSAHGLGSLYDGTPVGRFGDAEVFSLSPTKLVVAGEGGIVATNNDRVAERIRIGREYGNSGNYSCDRPGLNGRMSEFHALLGLKSLELLDSAVRHRNEVAGAIRDALGGLPGLSFQDVRGRDRSSYKDFSMVIDPAEFGLSRDQLAGALRHEGIDTRIYHFPPVHRLRAYHDALTGASLDVTERVADRILTLPIHSNMDEQTVRNMCDAIERVWSHRIDVAAAVSTQVGSCA